MKIWCFWIGACYWSAALCNVLRAPTLSRPIIDEIIEIALTQLSSLTWVVWTEFLSHLGCQIKCSQRTGHVPFFYQQFTPLELTSGKMRSVIASLAVDIHCLVKQLASMRLVCLLGSDKHDIATHLASSKSPSFILWVTSL